MKNGLIKEPIAGSHPIFEMGQGAVDIKIDNRSGFVVDVRITVSETVGIAMYVRAKRSRIKALLCKVRGHRWTVVALSMPSGISTTLVCNFCRTQRIADHHIMESSE